MIYSGSGNDTINVGLGSSLIYAGAGNDVIIAPDALAGNTIYAEDGDDQVQILNGQVFAGNGDDTLTGSGKFYGEAGNDSIISSDSDDLLDGGIGIDYLKGGLGNDIYFVDNLSDIVLENVEQGVDTVNSSVSYTLTSNVENLTLIGSSNINGTGNSLNNVLTGNASNNILSGGDGDDELYGGGGTKDQLIGGQGNDTYLIDNAGTKIIENANEGIDTVKSYASYTMAANIENLILLWEAKTAKGNDLDNRIIGNDLDNTLAGGLGNDYLDGGTGIDKLQGGAGNDTYIVDHIADNTVEASNDGIDTIHSTVSFTLLKNTENLTLLGAESINATGNTLNNILIGNSGVNILNGGAGNDILDGRGGDDQLTGGSGADTVIYQILEAADALGGNGKDTWSDFTLGNTSSNVNADKIDISDLLVDYAGDNSVGSLSPYLSTMVSGSNTQLYLDRDGSGSTYDSTLLLTLNNINTNLTDLMNNQQIMV
ncbi:MAG: calcium-binding protein [Acinetobacter sp.]|nr:calcium-binding protein [Acinetobacter sp.]